MRIEDEKEFKPNVSKLCDWCEFRPICPEWKHLYKIKDLSIEEFKKEDGVKLVNRLAEIEAQSKELEKEKEEIKKGIIGLAKREGLEVLFGSDAKARISLKEYAKFPGSTEKEREELEMTIKGLGKWEEVSTLNLMKLSSIAMKKEWPKKLLEEIARFQKMEMVEKVYLSKIKK